MKESDDSSSSDDEQSHFQYFQFTQRAEEPQDTVLILIREVDQFGPTRGHIT